MSLSPPLRVGIIGCGNVSVNDHAPVLRQLDFLTPVAVADPVPARREHILSILDLPASAGYGDHRAMLAANPLDYVVLAVPPSFRQSILADCAERGVHVLSEKPLATRPVEAEAMSVMMAGRGLKFGLVHNYLFYPEYQLLRRLIADGAVGEVRHITLNFLGVPDNPGSREYRPTWRHDPMEAGGGVLMDMIHAVYLAEYLLDSPFEAVSAVIDNLGYAGGVVEDLALLHLYGRQGYATINMGWGHGPGGVEVSGSAGRLLVFYQDYGTGPFAVLDSFTLINETGRQEFQPRNDQTHTRSFFGIHEDFAHAVRLDQTPLATAADGQRSLEATLAAYASAAQGRVIPLPLAADDPVYQRGVAGLQQLPCWPGSRLVQRRLFGLGVE